MTEKNSLKTAAADCQRKQRIFPDYGMGTWKIYTFKTLQLDANNLT